jgi:hypothetical protein
MEKPGSRPAVAHQCAKRQCSRAECSAPTDGQCPARAATECGAGRKWLQLYNRIQMAARAHLSCQEAIAKLHVRTQLNAARVERRVLRSTPLLDAVRCGAMRCGAVRCGAARDSCRRCEFSSVRRATCQCTRAGTAACSASHAMGQSPLRSRACEARPTALPPEHPSSAAQCQRTLRCPVPHAGRAWRGVPRTRPAGGTCVPTHPCARALLRAHRSS